MLGDDFQPRACFLDLVHKRGDLPRVTCETIQGSSHQDIGGAIAQELTHPLDAGSDE